MDNDREQDDGAELRQYQTGAERDAVEKAMQRYAEKGWYAHLMDIAIVFFTSVDEHETLHDKDKKKARQDRPADAGVQKSPGFRQHVKKHGAEQHSRAEAQQKRQGAVRKFAQERQKSAKQRDENDRR